MDDNGHRNQRPSPLKPGLSPWEVNLRKFDVVIIGGGAVGMSVGASLLENHPKLEVLVVDSGLFPNGASVKNAGFACFGSLTEILGDYRSVGTQDSLLLMKHRYDGLQLLRKRFRESEIGFEPCGGYDLIDYSQKDQMDKVADVNRDVKAVIGIEPYSIDDTFISRYGFSKAKVFSVVKNRYEGLLNSGLLMRSLRKLFCRLGGQIVSGGLVVSSQEELENGQVKIKGIGDQVQELKTNKVVCCTNGYSKSLLPNLSFKPGRGQVLLTEEVKGLKLDSGFHYQEGFFYFRNLGSRILLGGGRNLDFEGETTTEDSLTERIQRSLESLLKDLIVPSAGVVKIERRWSGVMAFGESKFPVLEEASDSCIVATRMGGMGVALASWVGDQVCKRWF